MKGNGYNIKRYEKEVVININRMQMYVGKRIDLFKYMLKVHQNKDDNGYITILLIPYSHQKKYIFKKTIS